MAIVWNLGASTNGSSDFGIELLFHAFANPAISDGFSNGFIMKDGDTIILFHGSFALNGGGDIQSGTITGFDVYDGTVDNHLVSASGYSIDFAAFSQGLAAWQTNNQIPLFKLLLGNPMTVNGADQLESGSLSEVVLGSSSADHLYGNGGGDLILDLGGADFIYGGAGNDTIGEDTFLAPGGNDVIYGGDGDDKVSGGGGDDFMSGGSGADTIDGEDGIDTADYSEKAETVMVTLSGPTEAIVLIGGVAEDKIRNVENVNGGQANDALSGDGLNNVLAGNLGNDKVLGNDGNDTLLGGGGRDRLDGGTGADTINGGEGRDKLIGGADSDTFVFDVKPASKNLDKVKDFKVFDDTIALDDAVFKKLDPGVLKAKFFQIGDSAGDSNDRVIYDEETGGLFYDKDGSGGAAQKQIAQLDAHLKLGHQDILVI